MKIRKNLLVFVLVLTLSFVLAACGNNNPSADTSSAADETEAISETLQTEEPAEDIYTADMQKGGRAGVPVWGRGF